MRNAEKSLENTLFNFLGAFPDVLLVIISSQIFEFEWTVQHMCKARHHMNFFQNLERAVALDNFISKSSCLQIFYKIGVLKNFVKFTEKCQCRSLFAKKLQTLKRHRIQRMSRNQAKSDSLRKL